MGVTNGLFTGDCGDSGVMGHGGSRKRFSFAVPAWVMPPISKLLAMHQRSLAKEPPIPLGTLDPYEPK